MTLADDTERMRIALTVIADTADAYLRNHAAELAEREAQNLRLMRTEARSLLKKMTNEETKEGEADMPVEQCTCGAMPKFVEICYGHKESVLLRGGRPNAFQIRCPKCGYRTAEHESGSDAVEEWNAHAQGEAK